MSESLNYKIVLVGDRETGKSSYIHRLETGKFNEEDNLALEATVHSLVFCSSYGLITFNTCIIPEQEVTPGFNDHHFPDAEGAIIMFDLTNETTYRNVSNKYHEIVRNCGNIPTVVCGNKSDICEHNSKPRKITFHEEKENRLQYYDISVKEIHNLENPFLWLARRLTRHPELDFVSAPAITPPEIPVDSALLELYRQQLEMDNTSFLEEDDDL